MKQADLNIMDRKMTNLFKFQSEVADYNVYFSINNEIRSLQKQWTWPNSLVAKVDQFFKILLYLRKNQGFKVIKNQSCYHSLNNIEEYIFFKEQIFITQLKPS